MLPPDVIVPGVRVCAAEFVSGVHIEPLAALNFESGTGGKGKAAAGTGFVVACGAFFVVSPGVACFAAHGQEHGVSNRYVEGVAQGDRREKKVLGGACFVAVAVSVAPLRGNLH